MQDTDQPIRFGTSGWRGIYGSEVTPERAWALARGAARWFGQAAPGAEVIVAWDTRAHSLRIAELAACALREEGLRPIADGRPLPTPVAAHAAVARGAAGALIVTASHNAAEYHGIKVFGARGASIDSESSGRVERLANEVLGERASIPDSREAWAAQDLLSGYIEGLESRIDAACLRRGQLAVVYDAMHGSGAGVLDRVLESSGVPVARLRSEPDASFGEGAPDPRAENLRELSRRLSSSAVGPTRLGLATDGDADRCVAVDEGGSVIACGHALAVLVDHLARTGRARRGLAISVATGSLAERVAAEHGLAVQRTPIGFKHLSAALESGVADVAGDESDGFGWAEMGRDKDGVLAGCLLSEVVAETGQPLAKRIAELERRHGRSLCGRTFAAATDSHRDALARLLGSPPERVAGARVISTAAGEGLRLAFADGFLMLRASGTEPLLRVYAEAPAERELAARLEAGLGLLGASGAFE